jgi:hypothetical protein
MATSTEQQVAANILKEETGVVIPVYLPTGIDTAQGERLLEDNVRLCCAQVDDPSLICLSVDGERFGAGVAERLAKEYGVSHTVSPVNRGKLQAARAGAHHLLEGKNIAYLALIDQDGDHFANELLNFIRAARTISEDSRCDRILILGRRISRHRPIGFFRGELEELADRILLDALAYRAAVTGRPLSLQYVTTLDEYPDVHSGYKLFSREAARDVFLGERHMAGVSEDCYYRHACEAVMVVEALETGAVLGTINRTTVNEQPVSTFDLMETSRLHADLIIWPCKRLDIPPSFVMQWMANHIPRLLLGTLRPDGKDELARIIDGVRKAFGDAVELPLRISQPPLV